MNRNSARAVAGALLLVPILAVVASTSGVAAQSAAEAAAAAPPLDGLVLPDPDAALQARLDSVLATPRFRSLVANRAISVVLIDLSGARMRYAGHDEDRMRYAASLPKIAIMLGVFDQIDRGNLEYTPSLRRKMESMIRDSDNRVSSELIELVGFDAIAAALRDPRWALYDPDREGGLWVGKGYGGGVGYWRRDPMANMSHGATARQAARFLVLMDRGQLVSEWASREMKSIMGDPGIRHKFVRGLLNFRPLSRIFRKSGTYRNWHADAALVERDGRKYVAVALLESPNHQGVLSQLIVELDKLISSPRPRRDE